MVFATENDIYWATPLNEYKSGWDIQQDLRSQKKRVSIGRFYVTMRRLVEQNFVEYQEDEDEDGKFRKYKRTTKGRSDKRERKSNRSLDTFLSPGFAT